MSDENGRTDVSVSLEEVPEAGEAPEGPGPVATFAVAGVPKEGLDVYRRWLELGESLKNVDESEFDRIHNERVRSLGLEEAIQQVAHMSALRVSLTALIEALTMDIGRTFGEELGRRVLAGDIPGKVVDLRTGAEIERTTAGDPVGDYAVDGIGRMNGFAGGN